MGFWKNLKEMSDNRKLRKQRKAEREKKVNQNPTEEQLKDSKNMKRAWMWTIFSILAYAGAFVIVAAGFSNNFFVGIIAMIVVIPVSTIFQKKAIDYAQEQRQINGKGFVVLLIAYIVPLIVLFAGIFYFTLGWVYR